MSSQPIYPVFRFRDSASDSEKERRLSEFRDAMQSVSMALSMSESPPIVLSAARTTLAAAYLLFNGRAFNNGTVTKLLTLEEIEWTMGCTLEAEFYGEGGSKITASKLTELYMCLTVIDDHTCWLSEAGIGVMDGLMMSTLGVTFVMPDFVTEFMGGLQ